MPQLTRFHGGAPRIPRAVIGGLALAGLAMMAYRYANLSLEPFINDEPAFLAAAREQVRSGHWLAVSPLVGKQGLHYGPTVLWFYGIVHVILGANPAAHIFAMLSFMVAAHLAFVGGIWKQFGALAGVTALALLASSPYQFFWSRLAWDQSVDICAAWIVFALCALDRITRRVGAGAFLGLVVGLAVSSHLMVLPLAILVFAFLGFESLRRREWKGLLAAGVAGLAVNLPYLGYLSHHYGEASPPESLSWELALRYALEPARVATLGGIDYFFDAAWPSFVTEEHWAGSRWLAPEVKTVVASVAAVGLLWAAWDGRGARRTAALLGVAAWISYAIFFGQRRVGDPPHYQFATWWIIPLGVAAAVSSLERRWRWVSIGASAAVWVLSVAQFRFIVDWMAYIARHGGTQGVHYGTPLAEQKSAIRATCAEGRDRILVFNDTHLFDLSLRYVASTEPSCAGKTVSFCGSDDCSRPEGAARVHIAYARPGYGWLFVRSVSP